VRRGGQASKVSALLRKDARIDEPDRTGGSPMRGRTALNKEKVGVKNTMSATIETAASRKGRSKGASISAGRVHQEVKIKEDVQDWVGRHRGERQRKMSARLISE